MKIRLLVSSDIHGAIMPYKYSDLKEIDYGFLKLKETMREYITDHTIIIDNGDILEVAPFLLKYMDIKVIDVMKDSVDLSL